MPTSAGKVKTDACKVEIDARKLDTDTSKIEKIERLYTVSQLNWYPFCFANKFVNSENNSIKFYRSLE